MQELRNRLQVQGKVAGESVPRSRCGMEPEGGYMSISLTTDLIRGLVDQGDGLRLSPYFKLTDQCSVCLGDVCEDPPKGEEY